MKKFQFSLGRIKGYREQILDREKNSLAFIHAQRVSLEDEKESARAELRRSSAEFSERAKVGVSIMQMNVFKSYQHSLGIRIKDIDEAIIELSDRIERQLERVVAATKDVNSLEKLEERQLEDYRAELIKDDERFIAEYVNNIAVRKNYKAI
ncbi:MAG: flagellar export protein FliJ [Ruminococcus sp.]|jgi:flagellar export protein FliJ|nr:flagellar export protein FliJ [Ruminococcus sp.]